MQNTQVAIPDKTPQQMVDEGRLQLRQLRDLVTKRPEKEKLIINGKQYLYFTDWQMLAYFSGVTARVVETKRLERAKPIGEDGKFTIIETIGFEARADAINAAGRVLSSAVAICMKEEKNWQNKELFALLSMAETRAMAKALRNVLQWIVKLPDSTFSDEIAEEQEVRG